MIGSNGEPLATDATLHSNCQRSERHEDVLTATVGQDPCCSGVQICEATGTYGTGGRAFCCCFVWV